MPKSSSPENSESSIPAHVAIVMDGNGRWAKKRLMPRAAGHKAGVGVLKNTVEIAAKKGVSSLTVFAFSSENWNRPQQEVSLLMDLFVSSIKKHIDDLIKAGVRLRFVGDRSVFSDKLLSSLEYAEEMTQQNTRLNLNVAMNYGGRWDITNAVKKLLRDQTDHTNLANDLDENSFSQYLELAEQPAVDLFIRTGGEHRISNFLLWQSAYSELYFTDAFWPDFNDAEFTKALDWFAGRQRRFGRTGEQLEEENQHNNKVAQ